MLKPKREWELGDKNKFHRERGRISGQHGHIYIFLLWESNPEAGDQKYPAKCEGILKPTASGPAWKAAQFWQKSYIDQGLGKDSCVRENNESEMVLLHVHNLQIWCARNPDFSYAFCQARRKQHENHAGNGWRMWLRPPRMGKAENPNKS